MHGTIKHVPGFTMIELMICITLMMILSVGALTSIRAMAERNQGAVTMNWLLEAIIYARQASIMNNAMVTLCPGPIGNRCGGPWHGTLVVFTDTNANRRIDGRDRILERFHYPSADGSTIRWRAFQNKQYLQMTGEGFTNYQNGNFVYCPRDRNPAFARQLVINIQGRVRVSRDIDGDGIVEDAKGRDLTCR